MAKLFDILAGKAEDTFSFGGVAFYAAPLTIAEYAEMGRLGQDEDGKQKVSEGELLEFIALKLQARVVKPTEHPPATITAEWLARNVPQAAFSLLQYLLVHGEMPKEDAEGKVKSR